MTKKTLLIFGTVAILFCFDFVASQEPGTERSAVPGQPPHPETIVPGFRVPPTLEEYEKELTKRRALAVMPDTPPVPIRGRVFLPDGSPAVSADARRTPRYHVSGAAPAFVLRDVHVFDMLGNRRTLPAEAAIIGHGLGAFTKEDGTFEVNMGAGVLPGSNVVIFAYRDTGQLSGAGRLISKPSVFVAREDMEPLNITLVEGIPLRGKVMYDNGTPASEHRFIFYQYVEPLVGADIAEIKMMCRSSHSGQSNRAGEYEMFLSPGTYTIYDAGQNKTVTLTIAETDTEKQFDFTVRMPIVVEAELRDGSLLQSVQYAFVGTDSGDHILNRTSWDGSFLLTLAKREGTLYLVHSDSKHGSIETIVPEMGGKTQRFKLKPLGSVTAVLVDAEGKPVSGERITMRLGNKDGNGGYYEVVTTDANGRVALSVPPGKTYIVLRLPLPFPLPVGVPRPVLGHAVVEQEINLSPGETLDFGTVTRK